MIWVHTGHKTMKNVNKEQINLNYTRSGPAESDFEIPVTWKGDDR